MHKIAAFIHFLCGLIYYKLAFSLVVLIGCVQTFLTIHSGKLSIPQATLRSKRRKMERVFYRWGGLLVCAIIAIGVLNDQNQFKADAKADEVVQQGRELGARSFAFYQRFPNGLPDNSVENAKSREQYERELQDLLSRAEKLAVIYPQASASVSTAVNRPIATAQGVTGFSIAPQAPSSDPYDALDVRIQILLNKIKNLDSDYAYSAGRALQNLERHPRDLTNDELIKLAGDRTRTRDDGYHDLQPEITNVRHLIQVALKLSPQEIDADERVFRDLNAKAQIRTSVPTSLDADYDGSYKFLAVRQYFVGLDKRLGYKLLNEDKLLDPSFSGPYQ